MDEREHRLEHLSWPQVRDAVASDTAVILPIGAIEQHGPNLPIDTDAYLAMELAVAGAQDRRAVVAPPIIYGCRSRPQSGGGELFPGTLSLDGITFIQLVSDVLGGLLRHGFRKLLVFSWHMENRGFVYEAASRAVVPYPDAKLVVMEEPFDSLSDATMDKLFPNGFPGWPLEHAGMLETSLLLFLRPSVVGESPRSGDRLVTRPYDVLPERDQTAEQTGVLWDASGASAESGELAYGEIVAHLQSVADREFGDASA
jgi:creatinine amidohydrolase